MEVASVEKSDMAADVGVINRDCWVIFVAGLFLFIIGLPPEFIGFQSRFALFAQEMLRYGPTFFPTTYQHPYPDYPAASTFLIYLLSLPWGRVTVFTAVLPTAIASALILVGIYRIGAIRSREWGGYAVLLALFTYAFYSNSRTISLDQYTSVVTVFSFYVAYSGTVFKKQKRLFFIPVLFIIGFVFRGPIGLIIPVATVCGFYLWRREFRKCILFCGVALVLFAVCCGGLLAAAYRQGGDNLVKKVIDMQAGGRVGGGSSNYFYYVVRGFVTYAVAYPLTLIVVAACGKNILKRKNDNYLLLGYCAVWAGIILLGMSIPAAKKSRYILPVVPPLALLAAYLFVYAGSSTIIHKTRQTLLGFCKLLPLASFLIAVVFYMLRNNCLTICPYHSFIAAGLLLGMTLAGMRLKNLLSERRGRDFMVLLLAVLSYMVLYIGFIAPLMFYREQTRPFVQKVEQLMKEKPGKIVFYKIGPDKEDIKFMVNWKGPLAPEFLAKFTGLNNSPPIRYYIAKQEDFARLPKDLDGDLQVYFYGRIGHKECVVFSVSSSRDM